MKKIKIMLFTFSLAFCFKNILAMEKNSENKIEIEISNFENDSNKNEAVQKNNNKENLNDKDSLDKVKKEENIEFLNYNGAFTWF